MDKSHKFQSKIRRFKERKERRSSCLKNLKPIQFYVQIQMMHFSFISCIVLILNSVIFLLGVSLYGLIPRRSAAAVIKSILGQ
jgi:membrane protein YqaA with SNARE-associated domain